jgi:hypothetical protein
MGYINLVRPEQQNLEEVGKPANIIDSNMLLILNMHLPFLL